MLQKKINVTKRYKCYKIVNKGRRTPVVLRITDSDTANRVRQRKRTTGFLIVFFPKLTTSVALVIRSKNPLQPLVLLGFAGKKNA